MPLPRRLTRFNRDVANKLTRPFARHLPGLGVLSHQGRRTGRIYETPMNVWRDGSRLVVALTYGDEVDWLRNARASRRSQMVTRGKTLVVGRPVDLASSEGMTAVPAPVRMALGVLGVTGFVAFPIIESA